jgi:hypothetical protein
VIEERLAQVQDEQRVCSVHPTPYANVAKLDTGDDARRAA